MNPSSTVESVSFRFCAMSGNCCPATWTNKIAQRPGNTGRQRLRRWTTCWPDIALVNHVLDLRQSLFQGAQLIIADRSILGSGRPHTSSAAICVSLNSSNDLTLLLATELPQQRRCVEVEVTARPEAKRSPACWWPRCVTTKRPQLSLQQATELRGGRSHRQTMLSLPLPSWQLWHFWHTSPCELFCCNNQVKLSVSSLWSCWWLKPSKRISSIHTLLIWC